MNLIIILTTLAAVAKCNPSLEAVHFTLDEKISQLQRDKRSADDLLSRTARQAQGCGRAPNLPPNTELSR